MNLGLDEREVEILRDAVRSSIELVKIRQTVGILPSIPIGEQEGDSELRQGLLNVLEGLPRYVAEYQAFAKRIDALDQISDEPARAEESLRLMLDLEAWKLPRQLSHEATSLRTMVEFLR